MGSFRSWDDLDREFGSLFQEQPVSLVQTTIVIEDRHLKTGMGIALWLKNHLYQATSDTGATKNNRNWNIKYVG
jgi:hypothetical protein